MRSRERQKATGNVKGNETFRGSRQSTLAANAMHNRNQAHSFVSSAAYLVFQLNESGKRCQKPRVDGLALYGPRPGAGPSFATEPKFMPKKDGTTRSYSTVQRARDS